jgi:flagellar biosynthesis chaperone FliJ
MIINDFLGAFLASDADAREAAERELQRVTEDRDHLETGLRELHMSYRNYAREMSARLNSSRSEVTHLRAKLQAVRPYVVAYAKGPSLQAKDDLKALDAVLRVVKP